MKVTHRVFYIQQMKQRYSRFYIEKQIVESVKKPAYYNRHW
jgi:hypothetical protein